jgi:hypothetical protein
MTSRDYHPWGDQPPSANVSITVPCGDVELTDPTPRSNRRVGDPNTIINTNHHLK